MNMIMMVTGLIAAAASGLAISYGMFLVGVPLFIVGFWLYSSGHSAFKNKESKSCKDS